jgi:hypothetical protein
MTPMTPFETLCNCFPEAPAGCCVTPEAQPAAPLKISNLPGLPTIRARIGTFTSFRRAMLDDLAQRVKARKASPFVEGAGAFKAWREGMDGDYQTLFVELWAYLADILTFYQERLANEAFLSTATQRDSLLRLCRLIDYRPNPGSGASALLAFSVEKNKTVLIPAGFRAGNKPVPGQDPAVFETGAALTALGLHNAIPIAALARTNQFAPLRAYEELLSPNTVAANAIYATAGPVILAGFPDLPTIPTPMEAATPVEFWKHTASRSFESRMVLRALREKSRPVVLQGLDTRLAPGDYVLIIEDKGDQQEAKPMLRQLDAVYADKASNTTTIFWTEDDTSTGYENVTLFALRVTARPFGSDAPNWHLLSPTLRGLVDSVEDAPFTDYWDLPESPIPDAENITAFPKQDTQTLDLDAVYNGAKGTKDEPGMLVLRAVNEDGTIKLSPVYHVENVSIIVASDYAMTAKVTRLSLREIVEASTYPLRSTIVLTGAERLTLQDNLPLPRMFAGNTLVLAGQYPHLAKGQKVMVRGKRLDTPPGPISEQPVAEEAVLAEKAEVANNITVVTLTAALHGSYERASTVLLANVVSATQGETVKDEVLGSGDGRAFQTFLLKKKPLTYLPATDPEGLSTVQSTLQVMVNGVQWKEQPTLAESQPDAQEHTTSLDDAGQTAVIFGDGRFGAKPPTGRDNIRARYRKGMGTNGNVAADKVTQLLDAVPGLTQVTNPQPTRGGLDQENPDRIRRNAPASLRTFGRAVSVQDYADLALSFPGVAKASATWVVCDPATGKAVAQPHVRLTIALADGTKLADQASFARRLRDFLDRRRDPNVPMRFNDCIEVYLDVDVEIDVEDRHPRRATAARVLAALSPNLNPAGVPGYFAFERLQFGQGIRLSDLYGAIQAVEGVRSAVVKQLRRRDQPASAGPPDDIFIRPTELAVLRNNPANPDTGTVTVTVRDGGIVDT